MHVSGRLSPRESNRTARVAFPPSQQSERACQQRATAQRSHPWKASMHTIVEEGEGEFGVVGERWEVGEGVEVRVVYKCIRGSVSIVVFLFPSFKK